MEQGNEGDEILFFSCRQIGCDVPEKVKRVGDLTAELLIHIIARCLFLISDGAVEVPTTLPSNIAVRHRICTDISAKVKDLGYPAECGYNQLLYPVESQARDLLKWTLDRVPRTQHEGGGEEEILGASALLSRDISHSLAKWKKSLWRLPGTLCVVRPPVSVYHCQGFVERESRAAELLSRHASERAREMRRTERLNARFASTGSTAGAAAAVEEKQNALLQRVLQSVRVVTEIDVSKTADKKKNKKKRNKKKRAKKTSENGESPVAGEDKSESEREEEEEEDEEDELATARESAQLTMSFTDLVRSIASDGERARERERESEIAHGTRFSHATVFAQENSLSLSLSSSASAVGLTATSGSASAALSVEHAARLAALSKESVENAQRLAKLDLEDRQREMEKEEAQRQEQLQSVKTEIEELNETVDAAAVFEAKIQKALDALQTTMDEMQKQTDELEKECIVKKKALEMMPSAAENIAKLQSICDSSTQRLKDLEQEWEKVKTPLDNELLVKEKRRAARLNRVSTMIEEIKQYRELMASMVHELKEQQDRAQLLEDEKAKLPKNINRALYTHRIMDITNSIAKQNKEIYKITTDIRDLQKSKNLSSSTLARSDAVTEELIYSAAADRNDPVMVEIYRKLKLLRSSFESLVGTVGAIGNTDKSQRDLETKIEQERHRVSTHNFQRIQHDLQAVQQENQTLLGEIKKRSK